MYEFQGEELARPNEFSVISVDEVERENSEDVGEKQVNG